MIVHNKYILASSSKSRFNILKQIKFDFNQVSPLCDEEKIKKKISKKNKPKEIAMILSFEKAKSVSLISKYSNCYIIGCDTLVYFGNKIFDKAKNLKDAKKKIGYLSGKEHKIVSGLTICKGGKKIWACSTTTKVKIKKLNTLEIDKYLKKTGRQILNSVGCYQIESLGPRIIEDIKGDFFNVMGFPLFKFLKHVSKNK